MPLQELAPRVQSLVLSVTLLFIILINWDKVGQASEPV